MKSRQSLSDPVTVLKGVGDTLAQRLAKLGIEQVGDLLFHLPLRYQDKTRIIPLATARAGQEALVEGVIQQASVHFGRRRTLSCTISDPAGQSLILRFFHFSSQQQQQLQAGLCLRCYGEIRRHKKQLEMVHPEYQVVQAGHITPVASTLTPVYPTTEGLQQKRFRDLIAQALSLLQQDTMTELLPDEAKLHEAAKLSLLEAIVYVHQPDPAADTQLLLDKKHPAQRRLAYEELLAQQLSLRQLQLQA
ncbi:MAG TPA: ATP-dependent DNA helicase RecG, partial [Gammaproteobacteria bacterium]|nr:ATP-dependent DNA helicase RecG [Gammaproteobacteria bacterium]